MADTTTTVQYDLLVMAGREAREQADNVQWVEGDLALQVETLPVGERPRDPETGLFIADPDKALKRYAEDIEVNYSTLREYRRTSEAWPSPTRVGEVSHRTHRVLNSLEDRFDVIRPGMTRREAEKLVRERTANAANYGGEPSWHELVGRVADAIIAAEKHLTKAEAVIAERVEARGYGPNEDFLAKAERYADLTEDLAGRLRTISQRAAA